MLLREIRNIFYKELEALYPKQEVEQFFTILIGHYYGLEPFILALEPKKMLSKEEEQPLFEALAALRLEKPIQYIIGETSFFGYRFKVNKNVLIPRPETEELVEWIILDYGGKKEEPLYILDIGTGSGCIAVSLVKEFPSAQITAWDISENALDIAKMNAKNNKVDIHFEQIDVLTLEKLTDTFDIIVSNPPYVRIQEKKDMHKNVKDYEPELALFVGDENPLVFYDSIFRSCHESIKARRNSLF